MSVASDIEQNRKGLTNFAKQLLRRNPADVEDLVQDTILSVLTSGIELEGPEHTRKLLYQTIRWRFGHYTERALAHKRGGAGTHPNSKLPSITEMNYEDADALDLLADPPEQEEATMLKELAARVPGFEYLMDSMAGMSTYEIARNHGVGQSTAWRAIEEARRQVRKLYGRASVKRKTKWLRWMPLLPVKRHPSARYA